MKQKKLYRSGRNRILGGVCGGIAEYFNIDPTFVRLLWILFSLAYGTGILFYFIAWIIIPRNPKHKW
jgi:phage shock protein PspC (stress-responsive transcriptional regulator)